MLTMSSLSYAERPIRILSPSITKTSSALAPVKTTKSLLGLRSYAKLSSQDI